MNVLIVIDDEDSYVDDFLPDVDVVMTPANQNNATIPLLPAPTPNTPPAPENPPPTTKMSRSPIEKNDEATDGDNKDEPDGNKSLGGADESQGSSDASGNGSTGGSSTVSSFRASTRVRATETIRPSRYRIEKPTTSTTGSNRGRPRKTTSDSTTTTKSAHAKRIRKRAAPTEEPEDDEDDEYEVEKIMKSKRVGRGTKYFVKWKGYPVSDGTWEPMDNLEHAKDLVEAFLKPIEEKEKAKATKSVNSTARIVSEREVSIPKDSSSSRANRVSSRSSSGAVSPVRPVVSGVEKVRKSTASKREKAVPTAPVEPVKRGVGRPRKSPLEPAKAPSINESDSKVTKPTKPANMDKIEKPRYEKETVKEAAKEDGEWEIKELLGSKGFGKWKRYLVKWKGFSSADNTWEPFANVAHCKKELKALEIREGK